MKLICRISYLNVRRKQGKIYHGKIISRKNENKWWNFIAYITAIKHTTVNWYVNFIHLNKHHPIASHLRKKYEHIKSDVTILGKRTKRRKTKLVSNTEMQGQWPVFQGLGLKNIQYSKQFLTRKCAVSLEKLDILSRCWKSPKGKNNLKRMNLSFFRRNTPLYENDRIWLTCQNLWPNDYIHNNWITNALIEIKATGSW